MGKIICQLPKLNGENYVTMSETAELVLSAFGYGEVIEGGRRRGRERRETRQSDASPIDGVAHPRRAQGE